MDIKLRFRESGSGSPLILLHGNGGDGDYFRNQMGPLGEHFHVMAVDTRGYGASPRGFKPFTIEQFSRDLVGFMDDRGIEKASVLGFSDGGNIALLAALAAPERFDKLILNGANLNPSGIKRLVQLPVEYEYTFSILAAHAARGYTKKKKYLQRRDRLKLMIYEPTLTQDDIRDMRVPTLVIVGTKDMIKDRHSRSIAKALPDSRFVRIEGDHFIAMKNPDAFNEAVLDFLLERK